MKRVSFAALAAIVMTSSAWALTPGMPNKADAGSMVVQVKKDQHPKGPSGPPYGNQYGKYGKKKPGMSHGPGKPGPGGPGYYKPGHKYSKAPSGWKRHSKRPVGWATRGCIVVGPVWFCP